MYKSWNDIVNDFPTIPYLFVGSGLTKRYLNLPGWSDLLKHFTKIISDDEFAYQYYLDKCGQKLDAVGSLLEKDFNEKWFSIPSIRSTAPDVINAVREGVSPFKAEVAEYIKRQSFPQEKYSEEIDLLKKLIDNNISGFITTNYDTFLESIAPSYKVYTGQEELIFSPLQEVAEIFKIHGSVKKPASIVITREDYDYFNRNCAYLAAKLMTIFMEYPIIFIGYSISDPNIRTILQAMVTCLSIENMEKLSNRFIFVKRNAMLNDEVRVTPSTMYFDNNKSITMTQLETNNFKLIFEPLQNKRAGIPIRLLRILKEELCNYTITNKPTKHVFVNTYDPSVSDDKICFSIGQEAHLVKNGLVGINSEQCYKYILFDNVIPYACDDILEYSIPSLLTQNPRLPLFKFLHNASKPHTEIRARIKYDECCFEGLISNSIKKNRYRKNFTDRSVSGILKQYTEKNELDLHALEYLSYLTEEEINIKELGDFLTSFLTQYPDALEKHTQNQNSKINEATKTNLRRLIRIYDFLRFYK